MVWAMLAVLCPSPTHVSSQSVLAREIWGQQAVPVQCFTAVWLYPRLGRVQVLHEQFGPCPWASPRCRALLGRGLPCRLHPACSAMVRGAWRHLSRHWLAYCVPLPASKAPAPCKYSPGVFMCKHCLMSSCSESHGKAADFPPCWSPQQHQAGRESPALNMHFLS